MDNTEVSSVHKNEIWGMLFKKLFYLLIYSLNVLVTTHLLQNKVSYPYSQLINLTNTVTLLFKASHHL